MINLTAVQKKPLSSGFFFPTFKLLAAACLLLTIFTATSLPALAGSESDYQSPLTVDGTILINTEDARKAHNKGFQFLDVRSLRQYNKRHIPGAYHLDLKSDLTRENMEKLFSKADPIIIYCNGPHCSRSSRAARSAVKWGFTNIHYYREGMRTWRRSGNPVEKATR